MTTPFYADEWVSLYHGDCLELADLWTCADVLVTDPPYGVAWEANQLDSDAGKRRAATQSIAGDESTETRDAALSAWGDRPAVIFGSWRADPPRCHPIASSGTRLVAPRESPRIPGSRRMRKSGSWVRAA